MTRTLKLFILTIMLGNFGCQAQTNKKMEENKEEFKGGMSVQPTFKAVEDIGETPGCRFMSGKTLRREYIYKKRDEYILEYNAIPDEKQMEEFAIEARKKYIEDGDYKVVNGEATWLGKY